MWNKREDTPGPRTMPPPRTPTQYETPRPEPAAAPPPPVEMSRPQPQAVSPQQATIGSSMMIVGEIFSREELTVDGEVEGTLELQHRLTVGPNGKVKAHIKAREVVVFGNVQGNVEVSDKIVIKKGGSLVGDIKSSGIVIDDGAYFKGSIDIVKSPPIVVAEQKKAEQKTEKTEKTVEQQKTVNA